MASGATVGSAVVKLEFDGSGVKASVAAVSSELEKAGSNGSKLSGAFDKARSGAVAAGKAIATTLTAATAGATASVLALGKASLNAYADYEQLIGGVETLFKDSAGIIESYAATAYQTAGLSANEYMEQATSFSARLIQGLGGDTEKAAEYANKAIVDMSDNANKMGTDISMIQNAYQGFAKQNYTMLDNLKLGYGGTASEMARLVNDSGVLGKTVKVTANTINDVSFDKIIEAVHVVQGNLGITGTTAKEASETISGSINTMKASWQNLMVAMASEEYDWGEAVDGLVNSLSNVIKNIGPRVIVIAEGIGEAIKEIVPIVTDLIPDIVGEFLPPFGEAIIELAFDLIDMVTSKLPQILIDLAPGIINGFVDLISYIGINAGMFRDGLIAVIVTVVNSIAQQLPTLLQAVVDGVMGVITSIHDPANLQMLLEASIALLLAIVHALPDILIQLMDALPTIIDNIITYLTDPVTIKMLLQAAIELWSALIAAVPQILGGLLGAFGKLVGSLWNGITKLFGTFAGKFGNFIGNIFKGAINGVIGFIEGFLNKPIDVINGFIDIINGAFGAVGVNISHISRINMPRLAKGGYASGATSAIIGEAGKEVVLPLEQNTDNWAGLLASTLAEQFEKEDTYAGREIVMNNTFEINNDMDANDIGRVLMQSMRRSA